MTALLLGAGFSKWAAGLPVASELFDLGVRPWGPREQGKLTRLKGLKEAWDSRHPHGHAEEFIAYALGLRTQTSQMVLWYLARRLSEPFLSADLYAGRWRRHVLAIDEPSVATHPGVTAARRLLSQARGPSLAGVVTTNYDMLLEYALGSRGFNYGLSGEMLWGRGPHSLAKWVRLTGGTQILKLHGSISWDATQRYTDGRCSLTGRALIVAPTPEKQPPDELADMWAHAETALTRADRLLVFGFAFNPYDEALLGLLRAAGQRLSSVLIVDPHPQVERAAALWPKAKVASCAPPPHQDAKIADWYAAWPRGSGVGGAVCDP